MGVGEERMGGEGKQGWEGEGGTGGDGEGGAPLELNVGSCCPPSPLSPDTPPSHLSHSLSSLPLLQLRFFSLKPGLDVGSVEHPGLNKSQNTQTSTLPTFHFKRIYRSWQVLSFTT